jgi:spermidine synthase
VGYFKVALNRAKRRSKSLVTAFIALVSGLLIAATPIPKPVLLERVHSQFNGDLAVLDYQGGRYLLAQSRLGAILDSAMDLRQKDRLMQDYLQVMALLTGLHPDPESIYNLGLGGGELIRFHLHQYGRSHIDSAEIDPHVVVIAKKFFDVSNDRHRILEGEGFDLLKRQPSKYDVIWVDDVISKEGPKAFVKAEYLDALHDRLSDKGVLVANLGEAPEPKYFSEVERDYRRGYAHGIRIKSPIPQYAAILHAMESVAFPSSPSSWNSSETPTRLPSFLIAVGNPPTLNCAHFWELYRKWTDQKLISIRWDSKQSIAQPNLLCQDLN